MTSALQTNSVLSGRRSKEETHDHRILETLAMKRHRPRAPAGRCGKGFGQQPSFYALVRVEGSLRLVTIGWDMAGEAEESLAPSALPQSTNHGMGACQAFPQSQLAVERPYHPSPGALSEVSSLLSRLQRLL
jgi:hypothetical protein